MNDQGEIKMLDKRYKDLKDLLALNVDRLSSFETLLYDFVHRTADTHEAGMFYLAADSIIQKVIRELEVMGKYISSDIGEVEIAICPSPHFICGARLKPRQGEGEA